MRILIVDDHPIYAEGLRNLLGSRDYRDVEVATDGASAVELAIERRPDVVLMDISMPGIDGIQATRLIHDRDPEAKIIILTSLGDSESLIEAVKAGASGYLLKTLDGDELIECLESLQKGRNPFSPGLGDALLLELRSPSRPGAASEATLGSRAESILGLLSEGLTYKEIGARLFLSERTIKYHIEQIKRSLGLDSKAQLVDYWRDRRRA